MAASRVAAVMGGAVALLGPAVCAAVGTAMEQPTATLSEPDAPPQFQDYVEYSWALPAASAVEGNRTRDECPSGFLPVWTLQRCQDAAAAWAREGITTDIKDEIVTDQQQENDADVLDAPPGCTLKLGAGEAVGAVSFRDVRLHEKSWGKVPADLPEKSHRVCYRLYVLAEDECPAAFQVISDREQCKQVAKAFADQDTVPEDAGANDSSCTVGADYTFAMKASGSRRVCALKDIIAYPKGADCPVGQDISKQECMSLTEMWPKTNRRFWQAGDSECPVKGKGRCTCSLRSPGHWHWHYVKPRVDLAPYCRSR